LETRNGGSWLSTLAKRNWTWNLNSRYTELIRLCFQHKWIASLGVQFPLCPSPPCS
jgi:hypothetical protein